MIPPDQIRDIVIRAILDNQEDGARAIPDANQITNDFCPIGDLDGFDSYSAMETVVELSDLLGCEIREGIFITGVRNRHANIGEIVDRLCHVINEQKRNTNGQQN